MTLPNELHPGFFSAAGGGADLGDPIEQSLRNDGTASFYRSSFPIKSRWTASFWFKPGRGYRSTGGGGYAFSWHFSGTSYVICGLGIGYPASYTGSSSNGNCLVVCVNGLSTWADINTSYQTRDSAAWQHHTVTSDNGTLIWYVNGESIGSVTGVKTSGTSVNFTIGGQAQGSSIQGYFADFHFTDGRIISPTEFARYNEDGIWVPKKYEATDYRKNWTDYVTSNTGSWYTNTGPEDMFDDRLTTYTQTNDSSGSSTITFTPPTPIPYTSSVEIYFGGPNVSLNGGANQTPTINQWSTIATGSGTITSLVFTGAYGGTVYGIRVDGVVLTTLYGEDGFHMTFDSSQANGIGHDSSGQGNHFTTSGYDTADVRVYSNDLYSMTTGSGNWDTTTSKNFSSNTPPTGFNGNLSDAVQVTTGDTWVWRPSYSLTATLVEVYPTNSSPNQKLYFNGTEVGGTYTGAAWNTVYTGSATTVNHIGGEFTGGGNGFYGIRVNGTILVDNRDNDVDFFDTPTSNYALWSPEASIDQTNVNLTDTNLRIGSVNSGANWKPGYVTFGPFECGKPGKYYFEMNDDDGTGYKTSNFGLTNTYKTSWSDFWWNTGDTLSWYPEAGTAYRNGGSAFSFGTGSTSGGKAMAIDFENGTVDAYSGGTLVGSLTGSSSNLTVGEKYYIVCGTSQTNSTTLPFNFGQMPFIYTPPTGYKALQTNNLPNATFKDGKVHFQAITGSGNAGGSGGRQGLWVPDLFTAPPGSRTQAHTSTASVFQSGETGKLRAFDGDTTTVAETSQLAPGGRPGWMSFRPSDTTLSGLTATSTFKVKVRRIAEMWVNGTQMTGDFTTNTGSLFDLSSQLTFPFTLESLEIGAISGNDAGLFGIELDGDYLIQQGILETAQATFPSGLWWIKALTSYQHQFIDSVRGSNLTLTCPALGGDDAYAPPSDPSVAWCWNYDSSNPSVNGFEIVTYTGNATVGRTVSHNLGKDPEFIITKERANNGNYWCFYHVGGGAGYGYLNDALAYQSAGAMWTAVSSTTWTYDANGQVNGNGINYVSYAWTSIEGFSKFGTYSGTGVGTSPNGEGEYVYLGFKPALVLIKRKDSATGGEWSIYDSSRSTTNPNRAVLSANNAMAETTMDGLDLLSNGFKVRGGSGTWVNESGGTYLYCAWAESPFGGANVPPATGR